MWKAPVKEEARRMHEVMCLAAVVIFPLFAVFDYYTIPVTHYWTLTFIRISISCAIGIGLLIQRRYDTDQIYLTLFSFCSISWFCCLACVLGGKSFLYQHNIAYCTVFLGASLFLLWNWFYSLFVVLSSVFTYGLLSYYLADFDFPIFLMEGGAALFTIMSLHPIVTYFRFNSLKREFALKAALKESYHKLLLSKEEAEERNHELLFAREKLNIANKELREVNQHLEELVHARTISYENSNGELKDALEELDMFFYSSFHDLKGPVARVKGLAMLALGDAKDEAAKTYGDLTLKTAVEMEQMLEKFNKINLLSQIKPEQSHINLFDFFFTVTQSADHSLAMFTIEGPQELFIKSDRRLLQLIAENILHNSILYKDDVRPLRVIIKIIPLGQDVQIIFLDNGLGIKPTIQEKVFQMFFRGNDRATGHGLGLYLVKKAVEKLNGVVEVKSEEGAFTQIRIVLTSVVV